MKVFTTLLLAFALAVGLGCNRDNPSPVAPDSANSIVEQPLPTEMQAMLDKYAGTVSLEAVTPPEVVAYDPPHPMPPLTDTSFDAYVVTLLWGRLGNLPPAPTPGETIWDGHAVINAVGHMEACRTIAFEPNQDAIVPEDNPLEVVWRSRTPSFDFDGVTLWVLVKRGVVYIQPPTFAIETTPFSLTLPIERLERYQAFFQVDDKNGFLIQARRVFPRFCPDGFMFGDWIRDDIGLDSGSFTGFWTVANNISAGRLEGRFSRRADEGIMDGFVFDNSGATIGFMNGTWEFDDPRMCPTCGKDAGWFRGEIRNLNGEIVGGYAGRFGDLSIPPIPGGNLNLKFAGRWWFNCRGVLNEGPRTSN